MDRCFKYTRYDLFNESALVQKHTVHSHATATQNFTPDEFRL